MTGGAAEIERAAMELLEEALELPTDEQISWIEARADVPEAVRLHALTLLRSDRDGPLSIQTGGASQSLAHDLPPPDLPGYRIVRDLGRGGMGAVWLAERDGADFEHRVAIKVIKPGVLIEALVERFRRERQILAQLNHANIARLYDGGETADGQPYIVMEYVAGRTLHEWIEEERPSLEQRLAMFRQIGQAVEFAHQNLVIHRDLTPNNVLVTLFGQAKLIDFGIARPHVTEPDAATVSSVSGLSLTPGFAAPERKTGLVSNTLTDIFSLGRILALLIDGQGQPELDAIAARAAAEEPAARYPSVGEMLEDIERFERHEPVSVHSTARTYRLGKFVRRERRLVAMAGAILLALVGGLGATAWAYDRAERERRTAEHRFDQLRDLAHFQLFDLHDKLDNVVGNTAARIELANRAQAYLLELAESNSADKGLQLETAQGLVRLAVIQGVPAHPNFGEPELATRNLERAEQIFGQLEQSGIAEAGTGLARARAYRAMLFAHGEHDTKSARETIAAAEAALDRVPAARRDWDWMTARRTVRMAGLEAADLDLASDRITQYADLLEADIDDWPRNRRDGYEARFDRAVVENYRAVVRHNEGTPASLREAVRLYLSSDRLFAALEEDFPNDPLTLYRRAWNASYGYSAAANARNPAVAERLLTQARASVDRLIRIEEADHSLVTFAERMKEAEAEFLSNSGRHRDAIALQKELVDRRLELIREDRKVGSVSDAAYGLAILGTIYRKAGEREGACGSWREAEKLMAELARRDSLLEAVGFLRAGVQANIKRCDAGAPVSEFGVLAET